MSVSTTSPIEGVESGTALRRIAWLAMAAALVTAGLITYGSWVRVSGSGLGCPDWPLCNGDVLPGEERAAAIEYGHRLLAGLTMLFVAGLGVTGFRRRREALAAAVALVSAAVLILVQAALGGITVLLDLPGSIRLAHLGMGLAVLGLLTAGGLVILARDWPPAPARVRPLPLVIVGAATIMVGGSIVATQTSFGCLNLPLCDSGASTMATWLHTLHRVLGLILAAGVAVIWAMMRRHGGTPPLYAALTALTVLVVAQMAIGAVAIRAAFPDDLRVLHVALATLLWWSLVAFWVLSAVSYKGPARDAGR